MALFLGCLSYAEVLRVCPFLTVENSKRRGDAWSVGIEGGNVLSLLTLHRRWSARTSWQTGWRIEPEFLRRTL
jgi:hypothetical protein